MSNKCLQSFISNAIDKQNKLWKTVRPTSFQNPQLRSVLTFFKFVHPWFSFGFAALYRPSFKIWSFSVFVTQFGSRFHCFKFDEFRRWHSFKLWNWEPLCHWLNVPWGNYLGACQWQTINKLYLMMILFH